MNKYLKMIFKYYLKKTLPEKLIFITLIFFIGNYIFDFGLDTNSNVFYFGIGLFFASILYQNILDRLKSDFKIKINEEKNKITNINSSLKDINNNISSISKSIDINSQLEPIFAHKGDRNVDLQNISIISSTKSASSYIFHNEKDEDFKNANSINNFKKIQLNLEKNGKKLHILKFFNKNAPQKKAPKASILDNGLNKLDFPSTFINLN